MINDGSADTSCRKCGRNNPKPEPKPPTNTNPKASAELRSEDLLAALVQLKTKYDDARVKWKKSGDALSEWYWEGRRDGINDAIGCEVELNERNSMTVRKQPNAALCNPAEDAGGAHTTNRNKYEQRT